MVGRIRSCPLCSATSFCPTIARRATTASGYDILALRTLFQKKIVSALGDKIGIGKESDIYIAATPEGKQVRGREGGERRKMARSEATSC